MKQEVNKSQFRDAFKTIGRGEQFSYEGLGALYDWLEEQEGYGDGAGDYCLDVIALCCEFTEATLDEVKQAYPAIKTFEDLRDNTTVIEVNDDTVIYQQF